LSAGIALFSHSPLSIYRITPGPDWSSTITTVAPLLTFHCVFSIGFGSTTSLAKLFNALGIFGQPKGEQEWRLPAVNGSVYYRSVYAVAHFIFATSSEIKMLVFTLCKFFLKNDQKKE